MKKLASHITAIVIGIVLALFLKSPRIEVVERLVQGPERVKEVIVEKEKVVTKVVVKKKTRVITKEVCSKQSPENQVPIYHVYFVEKKHRIKGLIGVGPKGLHISPVAGGFQVTTDYDLVGGAGYSYNVDRKYSVGVQALTNQTFLGTLGLDF